MMKELNFNELYGIEACYESVKRDVEQFGLNVFTMLGEYIVRAEQDTWFNEKMIEACKKYIKDNDIKWTDKRYKY